MQSRCGTVATLEKKVAQPILVAGIKRLKYRGYDSSGVAPLDNSRIHVQKSVGRISGREAILNRREATTLTNLAFWPKA